MVQNFYTITSTETKTKKNSCKTIVLEQISVKGVLFSNKENDKFELVYNYKEAESKLTIFDGFGKAKRVFQIKNYAKNDFDIFEIINDHVEKFYVKEGRLDDELECFDDNYKAYYLPNEYNESIKEFIKEVC